jgi:hypothetical protein
VVRVKEKGMVSMRSNIPEVEQLLKNLRKVEPKKLVRLELEGNSFKSYWPVLENTVHLLGLVGNLDLDVVPEKLIVNVHEQLQKVSDTFDRMLEYGAADESLSKTREAIGNELVECYHFLFKLLASLVPISDRIQVGATERFFEFTKKHIRDLTGNQEATLRDIESGFKSRCSAATKRIENLVADCESMAKHLGVSSYANHFGKQSREHRTAALVWLGVSGILFTITASLSLSLVSGVLSVGWFSSDLFIANELQGPQILNAMLGKAVLFSVLVSAMFWCGKAYKSNRHNYVMNRHRQNALNTFYKFIEAAEGSKEMKDAMLLQVSQCIFSSRDSGYSTSKEDAVPSPMMLEILKNMK